jgi:hypothetical protein
LTKPNPAGYSGTPLVQKLGYKPDSRVYLDGAPGGYRDLLGAVPDGVAFLDEATAPLDLVHLFTASRAELAKKLARYRKLVADAGAVWVSWPKKAAKVPTDVTEDVVREVALPLGFVDVKVCAVDATWSGLKLVVRTELRKKA